MAENSVQSPKKRQFLFNPLKRPMPYIGLILAALIIIFQGTIRQYTANVVGGWLVSSLKTSTQGNYTLSYDFVRFDVFTKELRISNLDLKLDSTVTTPEQYLEDYSNLIDISTPVVVIKLESLWDLIVNDKLLIAYIGMEEPRVDLIRSTLLTEEETDEKQQQTAEEIRSYLEAIEIDSFRIANGSLRIDLQDELMGEILDYRVANFSTVLKGFQLSNIDPDKPFQGIFVDEVELEIEDQKLRLPRLNHNLSFEKLRVSSTDSLITLDSLQFSPISLDSSGLKSTVSLKQLALSSLDFKKAYDDFSLDLGTIKLEELKLVIQDLPAVESEGTSVDFFSSLPFSDYTLDTFQIINSRVDLDMNRKVAVGNFDIQLINYSVDSSGLSMQKLLENITEFNINLADTYIELPDSIHEARIARTTISSDNRDIKLNSIRINPISNRRTYALYKQQGANLITYGNVKTIEVNNIKFDELFSNQQVMVDSIRLFSPSMNITQYPYINSNSGSSSANFPYLLENIEIINGNINFNKRQNASDNRTELLGINFLAQGVYPEDEFKPTFDQLQLSITEGSSQLNGIQHNLRFNNLTSKDLSRLDIARFEIQPDTTLTNKSKFNVTGTGFSLVGYTRDFLSNTDFLELEELSAQSIKADIKLVGDTAKTVSKSDLKDLVVNRFYFNDADINLQSDNLKVEYQNISSFVDSLHYSVYDTVHAIPISFKDLLLSHGPFSFTNQGKSKFRLSGQSGNFSENDSLISFSDLKYTIDDQLDGSLKNIEVKGFDRQGYLNSRLLRFDYALLKEHEMELVLNNNPGGANSGKLESEKIREILLSQFSAIDFDSLSYQNGHIGLITNGRTTRLKNTNIAIVDYKFDSTTAILNILKPESFGVNIAEVTSISQKDSIVINGIAMDLVNNSVFTGAIQSRFDLNSDGILTASSPGITTKGMQLRKILEQDFSVDTVLLNNSSFTLTTTDSSENAVDIGAQSRKVSRGIANLFSRQTNIKYDSTLRSKFRLIDLSEVELDSGGTINFEPIMKNSRLPSSEQNTEMDSALSMLDQQQLDTIVHALPTHGRLGYLGMNNSQFTWLENDSLHKQLGDIRFSLNLDHVVLDSTNSFNAYNHIHDIKFEVIDYNWDLPDGLNSLGFDKLSFSSRDKTTMLKNIHFTPLVDKYEYANKVGKQVGWHNLYDLNITLSNLDIHRLINDKVVHLASLETNGGILDIFKDHELPIPEDQYRPMLQDAIKDVELPFVIDTLNIDDFNINFSSRLSADMPEGAISFNELTGRSSNITNIDTLLFDNPELKLVASSKIMNDGLLETNFKFNMLDPENGFDFDAHLSAMSAKDFNNILEALAYVKVESGNIKEINLAASGDNYYSLGKMTFQYSDLKVSTITKKNLKTTGMGKVIKTFFANAFVVKKNNPSVKFFPREGDMFYERDTQKIIIDYVAKTAMSGIVSSIGARNFRKDIRQIQKESQKQIDEEKKAQRKMERQSSLP